METDIQYSYSLPTHYDCCLTFNAIHRLCVQQEKHITSACVIIKNGMAPYSRQRGKEQGIKHHQNELLRKENFDNLIHEFSCRKAHKVLL